MYRVGCCGGGSGAGGGGRASVGRLVHGDKHSTAVTAVGLRLKDRATRGRWHNTRRLLALLFASQLLLC